MIFESKQYRTRNNLERVIQAECGNNVQANRDLGHEIRGTSDDLKRLKLSDTSTVFGVKCVITNESKKTKNTKKWNTGPLKRAQRPIKPSKKA